MAHTLKDFIKLLPKAELHLHIEGTLEPEMMMALAEQNNIKLPYASIEEARLSRNFKDLQSFLDLYYAGASVLIHDQDFYQLTYAYLEKAAGDNVKHVEIFFDPQTHTSRGIGWATFFPPMLRASSDAREKLGIDSKFIMCFVRHLGPGAAMQALEEALPHIQHIIAVGLDSTELGNPPSEYQDVFDRAREEGLLTVAHAGEEGPPEFVWQALKCLHISRLDHGVRSLEDPSLMKHLADAKVPLTVCPISNVKLKVYNGHLQEKLTQLVKSPLVITLNSDDPAYFGGYVSDNYAYAAETCCLSAQQLAEVAKNSFTASFISQKDKDKYHAMVDQVLADYLQATTQ